MALDCLLNFEGKWFARHCLKHIENAIQFPLKGHYSLKELCIVAVVKNKLYFNSVSNDLESDIDAFVERDTQKRYSIVKGVLKALNNIAEGALLTILSDTIVVCFYYCCFLTL